MDWAPPAGITVLERGWLSSNNVLLHGPAGHGALLIDTGYVTHAAQTVALVEAALRGQPLSAILNTHLHSDHCGGNAALAARFGCPIWIPPGDFDAALRWDDSRLSFRDTGQRCERFAPSAVLKPGTTLPAPLDQWEVHAAPGHDPASVVLFEPEARTLISADALWENGFGIVFPELDGRDAFQDVEATLKHIERLNARWVIPGHGAPFHDVPAAVGRAWQRIDYFRREPERHAHHAVKALLMFHMLEVGIVRRDALATWVANTPIFTRVHQRFFASSGDALGFAETLIQELVKAAVLSVTTDADGAAQLSVA